MCTAPKFVQAWIHNGAEANKEKLEALYGYDISLNELYACFHGKIVEFAKEYTRGK